ncbi:MAG: glycoside hydrolase family 38 C-terminal domain-containing protein [Bacteroidota bacterium]
MSTALTRIRLSPLLFSLVVLPALCLAGFKESVEQTLHLVQAFEGCAEGYGSTSIGATLQYPRIRSDAPNALISRATDGKQVIEWLTGPVPATRSTESVSFVVRAGIYGQEEPGKKFHLFVDGAERIAFSTSNRDRWVIKGENGSELFFESVMKDQFGDLFGYLRLTIPSSWTTGDAPVRLKIVGENEGSSAWVMIYQDSTALSYLREQALEQAWCRVDVDLSGPEALATCMASSSWVGRHMTWQVGSQAPGSTELTSHDKFARAVFHMELKPHDALTLSVGMDTLFRGAISGDSLTESAIYPKRLVTRRSSSGVQSWSVEYQSTYMPELGTSLLELSDESRGKGSQYLIISSHQDIAWMDTPTECVKERDEKVITPALSLLHDDPRFCFDLEDVLELREYLDRHPDRKDEISGFIKQGRLGIGASFNMPYEDLCSGEMLVRQFYAGLRWLRKNLPGCDSRTVWNPDVPGRSTQALQVMHKAGVRFLLISRQKPGLYDWSSPDGSSVLVFSPGHYALFNERTTGKPFPEAAAYLASFDRQWEAAVNKESTNTPVLSMSDMSAPVRYDDFIDTWNGLHSIAVAGGKSRPLTLPSLHYSTASAFFSAVEREDAPRPTIRGERPNIWLYIHGPTHHRAIDAKRQADGFLTSAEIFSTVDGLLEHSFARYPQEELTNAWEAQLYPDHGWGGKNGEITDSTFRAKFEFARDVARRITTSATNALASRVKTSSRKGVPLVIFNSLSWKRSSPVECTVQFPPALFRGSFSLSTSSGKSVPVQLLSITRNSDGSLKSARIVFVAENVPSIGYSTYYVHSVKGVPALAGKDTAAPPLLESADYRLALSAGGIQQIYDKDLRRNLLSTGKFLGGELFTMQSVGEDAGEWSEPQQPTMEGFDQLQRHKPVWRLVETGPVRQVVELRQDIDHATVHQRLLLYNHLKQLDVETALLRWDGTKYREFRLAFPVAMPKGQVTYEVPFGTVEVGKDELPGAPGERYTQDARQIRPRSIQNWIDVSDSTAGITISSSVAVWDYKDPTDHPEAMPVLQPVLLASRKSCHWEGNWYLQKGDHSFRFSLTSHSRGWRMGRQFGVGANTPLFVAAGPFQNIRKTLPEQESFFSLDSQNVLLSTMKKAEDGDRVVLRLVEEEGRAGKVTLNVFEQVHRAEQTNIIENDGKVVPAEGKHLSLDIAGHAIETFVLDF